MTQVRKSGGHGKLASVLFFPTRSHQQFMIKCFSDFLKM